MGLVNPRGAGTPNIAAYIRLAANQVFAAVPAAVLFDTASFDSAGYFDAANHRLVVPAGKAGFHLIGCQVQLSGLAGAGHYNYRLNNSGANSNVFASTTNGPAFWNATSSLVVRAAVGDTFDLSIGTVGGNAFTGTIVGGANGSVLWAIYLGP